MPHADHQLDGGNGATATLCSQTNSRFQTDKRGFLGKVCVLVHWSNTQELAI